MDYCRCKKKLKTVIVSKVALNKKYLVMLAFKSKPMALKIKCLKMLIPPQMDYLVTEMNKKL